MAKKLVMGVVVLALLSIFTLPAVAQGSAEGSVKGNLAGVVSDTTGAVVPGAKVTMTGPEGSKSDTTNADGGFLFPLLTPGTYTVKVEKGQFKTAEVKGVEVFTGKTSSLRLAMQPGEASTVIEVSGNVQTVDVTTSTVAANLNDTFYSAVPVSRGITGLFYASPGVTSGGGTGTANPSIGGATGLENQYIADGVSITDGAFGGIGVYSRLYGSLGSGINLSFVKEVQVKTGGFDAQYGKATGGIVNIVTKGGGNKFSGSIGGYFAPEQFEATRLFTDDFEQGGLNERFNLQGKVLSQHNYDIDAQIGGYVPHYKNHLFFFGAFNPQWNADQDQYAQFRNVSDTGIPPSTTGTQGSAGAVDISQRVYSYSAKLTWKVNDNHTFESSVFGDPTYGDNAPNGPALVTSNPNGDVSDKLEFGTRNWVVRYNGVLTPTWLVNASFSWGHNNLSDTPAAPSVFFVTDLMQNLTCGSPSFNNNCTAVTNPGRGQFTRQGEGYFENTTGDNYGYKFDTTKSFHFLGSHSVTFGYSYDRSHYDGTKLRTGGYLPISAAQASALFPAPFDAQAAAQGINATFQFRARGGSSCIGGANQAEIYIPGFGVPGVGSGCADGGLGVSLRQTRGEFGSPNFATQSNYHTLFGQDTWNLNKYVTVTAGLRWEQQQVQGTTISYTFTDNWSPRAGIIIDPWGNRKTKIFANFARVTESLPLDAAIRSLSNELDFPDTNWVPPTDGAGHVLLAADGTIDLSTLEPATLASGLVTNPANGFIRSFNSSFSSQSTTGFAPGARSEYLDEYILGFEHEFGNSGVIFTARYQDKHIKRIVEDTAELNPEFAQGAGLDPNPDPLALCNAANTGGNGCGGAQFYLISNPSKAQDIFVNPTQIDFNSGGPVPAGCTSTGTNVTLFSQPTDSNGNTVLVNGNDSMCVPNAFDISGNQLVAILGSDGIPDGFVDPIHIYRSMEFEVNKSYSKGWQLRANYRIAKLQGNYEGSFRNDNGQSDPNISSLFDFTRGDFNLLGQQFVSGVLNTDVRHLVNGYVSYTFGNKWMKGLTLGTSTHFQTGIPINIFGAHPVYANAGEIPLCADFTATSCATARGAGGRIHNSGYVDVQADYPIRISERYRLHLNAALFNITDMRTQLRQDQNLQRTIASPNVDFGKPTGIGPSAVTGNTNPGYQRPFYARFGVKLEF